jgi:hypothetical protein
MTADTQALLVRQTFGDRSKEEIAELSIECLHDRETPDPLDPAKFARGLESVVGFLDGTVNLFCDWSERYQKHPNALPQEDPEICRRVGGDPAIAYFNSYWSLAPGEALVVELSHAPGMPRVGRRVCNFTVWSPSTAAPPHGRQQVAAHVKPDGAPYESSWPPRNRASNGSRPRATRRLPLLFRLTGVRRRSSADDAGHPLARHRAASTNAQVGHEDRPLSFHRRGVRPPLLTLEAHRTTIR